MPGPMKAVIGLFVGMLAAIGPVIVAYGTLSLMTSIAALRDLPQLATALNRVRIAFKGVGIAAAATFALFAAREVGIFIADKVFDNQLANVSQLTERMQQLSNVARDFEGFDLRFDPNTERFLLGRESAAALREMDSAAREVFKSLSGLGGILREEGFLRDLTHDVLDFVDAFTFGGGSFLARQADPTIDVTRDAIKTLDNAIASAVREGNIPEAARQFGIFGVALQSVARGSFGVELDLNRLKRLFPELSFALDVHNLSWEDFLHNIQLQVEANKFLQSELSKTAQEINSLRENVQSLRQDYVDLSEAMANQFNIFKQFRDAQSRLNELMEESVIRFDEQSGAARVFERQGKELKDVTDEVFDLWFQIPGLVAKIQQSGGFGALLDNAELFGGALTENDRLLQGLLITLGIELPAAAAEAGRIEALLEPAISETDARINTLLNKLAELGALEPFNLFTDEFGRPFPTQEIFTTLTGDVDEALEAALQQVLFDVEVQFAQIGIDAAEALEGQKGTLNDAAANLVSDVPEFFPKNSPAGMGPLKDYWFRIENAGQIIAEALAAGLIGNTGLVAAAMTEMLQGVANFDGADDAIEAAGVELTRVLFRGMARGVTIQLPLLNAFALTVAIHLQLALFRQNPFIMLAGESLPRSLADGIRRGIFHVESAIRDLEAAINAAIGNMQIDGSSITRRLASGIRSGSTSVNTAMDDTLVGINDRLPSSPARLGPLSGAGDPLLAGREIVNRLIEGMRDREVGLSSALTQMLTPLGGVASDLQLPQTRSTGVGLGGAVSTSSSVDQSLNLGGITVVSPRPEAAGRAIVTEVSDTVYLSTGRSLR
jgi:hypothetical protein